MNKYFGHRHLPHKYFDIYQQATLLSNIVNYLYPGIHQQEYI